jgi:hypothetical protein
MLTRDIGRIRSMVQNRMFSPRHQFKIFDTIVGNISVFMMDHEKRHWTNG